MSCKPPSVPPSSEKSSESTTSASTNSEKSTASVHDTDYRQSLSFRDIFIERENAPQGLTRRAWNIMTRARQDPDLNDATVQKVIDMSRGLQDAAEAIIMHQLAPIIIPAMFRIPDKRLAMNCGQQWLNSVPVPLRSSVLHDPLPLPQPKPDLVFGYSEAAFTRNQLDTIGLLTDDQSGGNYAAPDQKVRFPFLQVEFKSQAYNGTHYVAKNHAAVLELSL
ncbi:hypothetical protein HRR83_000606 [Exophiala dermatitidis]|uniref:DUF7924 domain-containing protein n=1 Tax=Exophiala dermatitidis TaxID=5970 RepID=A0AAN6F5A8_EXODE|nr:hypothetical protein HRR74_000609 [Exophiala dermatitidis]KAJ4528488.1 hypothetical protein HRR73_001111 [Exophiala dermatitidis]KAJ4529857.1 hypothetical protein HRR76_009108 [Exophiala dermatitidis]KAJ4558616.1 hypothetical protein HRR77_000607 [Exophiala dermatitidis]KAJ4581351.1 hypothetical protein HRR79_000390 [Exophiala dermatitidis]